MQGVDTKIDDVENRQEAVDHVRLQVGNLFESTEQTRIDEMKVLEANLENLKEQRTVLDHVA